MMGASELNATTGLDDLGRSQHCDAFQDNDIDGEVLPDLTDDDLMELGITSLRQRKRSIFTSGLAVMRRTPIGIGREVSKTFIGGD